MWLEPPNIPLVQTVVCLKWFTSGGNTGLSWRSDRVDSSWRPTGKTEVGPQGEQGLSELLKSGSPRDQGT